MAVVATTGCSLREPRSLHSTLQGYNRALPMGAKAVATEFCYHIGHRRWLLVVENHSCLRQPSSIGAYRASCWQQRYAPDGALNGIATVVATTGCSLREPEHSHTTLQGYNRVRALGAEI